LATSQSGVGDLSSDTRRIIAQLFSFCNPFFANFAAPAILFP